MKQGIHPTYYKDATVTCACGAVYSVGSTEKDLKVEICAACHPFYTGKQKLIDSAGRVDKFKAKMEAAAKMQQAKSAKKERTTKAEAKTEEKVKTKIEDKKEDK